MDLYFGRKLKKNLFFFTNQLAFKYLLPNAKLTNTNVKSSSTIDINNPSISLANILFVGM